MRLLRATGARSPASGRRLFPDCLPGYIRVNSSGLSGRERSRQTGRGDLSQDDGKTGKENRELIVTTVLRRERISPSYARLTLGGGTLRHLPKHGFDHWFRLFIPRAGHESTDIPTGTAEPNWLSRYQALASGERPEMRYVTVRQHRLSGGSAGHGPEIDVDIVIHGDPEAPQCGPLSRWAQTAEPGGRVGILDQGALFRHEPAPSEVWLVGDETALPAFAGILASLPDHTSGRVIVEVPDEADVQQLNGPPNVEISWFPRTADLRPGALALAAVRQLAPEAGPYVYGAGEMNLTKELNGYLVQELGWPKESVHTVGYWRA